MTDHAAISTRLQKMWGARDFARIAVTAVIVGERLCETVDLRPGEFDALEANRGGLVEALLVGRPKPVRTMPPEPKPLSAVPSGR